MNKTKNAALAATVCAMFSMQGGAAIAKYLFRIAGPSGATALRNGFSAVILLLLCRPKFWRFSKTDWLLAALYGLSLGGMNLIFYHGIERIPLGIGVAVEFIGPLTLAVFTSRKPLDFLWILLAAAGIVLIVPWNTGEQLDMLGVLLVLIAGGLWAAYIVSGKLVTKHLNCQDAVAVGMCFASLLTVPFGLASGKLVPFSRELFLYGLGVACFSGSFPFLLESFGLKNLPTKVFSVLLSVEPAVAAVSGWIFVHEILSLKQWCAVFCVVAASAGITLFSREKEPVPEKKG